MQAILRDKLLYLRSRDKLRLKEVVEGVPPGKKEQCKGKRTDQCEEKKMLRPSFHLFYDEHCIKRSSKESQTMVEKFTSESDPFRFAHVIDDVVCLSLYAFD
jgi:hypothetical protein